MNGMILVESRIDEYRHESELKGNSPHLLNAIEDKGEDGKGYEPDKFFLFLRGSIIRRLNELGCKYEEYENVWLD